MAEHPELWRQPDYNRPPLEADEGRGGKALRACLRAAGFCRRPRWSSQSGRGEPVTRQRAKGGRDVQELRDEIRYLRQRVRDLENSINEAWWNAGWNEGWDAAGWD